MDNLPAYIYIVFGLTLLLAVYLFYRAANSSELFISVISLWMLLQGIIGLTGFYTVSGSIPPRIILLVLPPVISIIILLSSKKGKKFIDCLNIRTLTIFHIIRIPVEIVLFWLFNHRAIPELMTFEGRNFDIFSGLSAPIIYYFSFVKPLLDRRVLLLWNFICLALLVNIVANAILSVPTAFQQFAFEQPNIAILHFPFILLPAVLVPLVLLAHLAAIRQFIKAV